MADKIKSCPFCGGEAKLNFSSPYFVKCSKCFAKSGVASTPAFAVINWNTRKPMDRILEKLIEENEHSNKHHKEEFSFRAGPGVAINIVKAGGKDE